MKKNILNKINFKKEEKVVLCHGVFDVIHSGHLKYFSQAKKYGDKLIVSVTVDQFVNKGPYRPINTIKDRVEFLRNIKSIDNVIISNFPTAEKIIEKIKPNFYCKGPDYINKTMKDKNLAREILKVKKYGGKFVVVNHKAKSSSKIIKKLNLDLDNSEFSQYLHKIRSKYSIADIEKSLKKIKKINVLVLGEMIIDKYIFAEAIGKSGKDAMLVFKEKNQKKFIGGSGLISNLCSSFVDKVNQVFHIGKNNSDLNFIKSQLNKKINYKFLYKNNSPTITKLRYLDSYKNTKIIGIYNLNDEVLNNEEEKLFIKELKKHLKKSSIIILADYGHGEITDKIRNELQNYSNKLFLNTQINSFNSGHHTLKKYKKVNTLCINEGELRYEMKDRVSTLDEIVEKLYKEIKFNYFVVTRGKYGSIIYRKNKKLLSCPAFNQNPVDTIGSGDTFFSMLSLGISSKINPDLCVMLATMAAGFSVKNLGNQKVYNPDKLVRDLKYII